MTFAREPNAEPIPGYRLIEPLGSGGFGEVWKCEAPGGLFKAIKFIFGNLNSLDVDSVRAEQEHQALHRVKEVRHPFVLSMERIEVVQGEVVLVMELADKSLHDAYVECQSAGMIGIPRDALLRYIRDAAEALDHMNEKHNLQHLDIKPRNLFLISDRVKVADFGLVKHLERHGGTSLLGGVTPLYAPPETFNGRITEFSDQYSLAIVYQELLTGQRPFTGKNVRQLAQQHLQSEPDLRALPEAERPAVARALAKEPEKRFPNCLAFVRALYTSQGRARSERTAAESTDPSQARPKTLSETLEDIHLEQLEEVGNGAVAAPAAKVEEEPRLGITVAQPQSGALRPTVVIGLGSFGRRALVELRCRFLDRFGDLSKLPLLRFLYVDTDLDGARSAQLGTTEIALSQSEVYALRLKPVGEYRRRMLDHLHEWLPREKLYALPRSLQTQGSRALGRLAFVDNHLRFQAKLRREVQHVTSPDTLYQSVSQTGLALRDGVPRICVIAAASGGSSGCLVDLSYTLRHLLQQLRYPEAEITLFLFCGTPTDPATPRAEQANLYATLTELNHFHDPSVPFAAQYGADGPRIVDQGQPVTCTYLLQARERSPGAFQDTVSHLGSYLFHELTTPLGLRLDRSRRLPPEHQGATCFRSFGTSAIWFPRGLLLRLAARQACQRLLDVWQAEGEPNAQIEVEAAVARVLADSALRPEAVAAALEEAAIAFLEGKPAEILTGLLTMLEEQSQQSVAQDDPGNWARQSLNRIRDWAGVSLAPQASGSSTNQTLNEWQRSRLSRGMKGAAERLADTWDKQLMKAAAALTEHPGRRVAAAQSAVEQFIQFCHDSAEAYQTRLVHQAPQTHQAWRQLETALEGCLAGAGSFTFFGNRSRRLLRVFMDRLAAFARQRLAEEVAHGAQEFFTFLRARLGDRLRDLGFVRQRLRHLQDNLESPPPETEEMAMTPYGPDGSGNRSPLPTTKAFWHSIRESAATARVVLPDGEVDLEQAAARFLATLGPEHWTQLDQSLQDYVLVHLGGLHQACMNSGDVVRRLAVPMLDQAAATLSEHLPITDVAQIELSSAADQQIDVADQMQTYFASAVPLVAGKDPANQLAFLLVPASDAGRTFGDIAQQTLADMQLVRVPGQAHLTFCREQGYLDADELQEFLRPCREAYNYSAVVPSSSPHARFDIVDWVPLDP